MHVDRRILLLDRARRWTGKGIADMSLEEIEHNRETRLPSVPVLDPLIRRLGTAMFGRPRSEVPIRRLSAPGPAGEIPIRLYTPPPDGVGSGAAPPLVVFFHGGGWVLSRPHLYDWLCTTLAADAGVVVASVDYRLAPEDPAPAAREDAVAATTWLAEHTAELGAGGPLAVAGDSAGGNLAALVAIAARDAGGPPIDLQVLIYPGVDLTRSFPSIRELADAPILTRSDIDAFVTHYLDGSELAADDPTVSPWFVEDLTSLPRALVQTAEADPLRDEGRAYAERLETAGVPTRLTEYVGVPHGFLSLPGLTPAARQAAAEITQELRRLVP